MTNQVTTTIKVLHTGRNRNTVFWRGILVAPAFIFLATFSTSTWSEGSDTGIGAAGVVFIPTVLALLFRKKYPSFVLTFNHAVLELGTRVFAYLFLLNDDYPSIERNPNVAIIFPDVEGGAKLKRGKYPAWAGEIVLGSFAYWNRVQGYMLLLVTDEYPTFRLK
ncbi:MAG: hypothetical protein NTX60_01820 [Actinobacteria bacterium]|nr:hypothetical protein [Actinomycetota bacterium]